MRALLANLGFLLQFSGILILSTAFLTLYFNEVQASVSFFITVSILFVFGFTLNALCERKEISVRDGMILLFLTFLLLGLIGTIPYLYLKVFGEISLESFTNSFFESVSTITTTGLSSIKSFEEFPISLRVYRSISSFAGGIGIVFIFLTFLYPDTQLTSFQKIFGLSETEKIKKKFLSILLFYAICFFVFSFLFYFFYKDFLTVSTFTLSSLSTSSFPNVQDVLARIPLPLIILPMLVGATNIKIFISSQRKFYLAELCLLLASIAILLFFFVQSGFDFYSSMFHSASLATTSGSSFVSFSSVAEYVKIVMIVAMFIGGCSLSTAGGLKCLRILLIGKSVKKVVKNVFKKSEEISEEESVAYLLFFLMVSFAVLSSFILALYGFGFLDSLLESVSAISNTGISLGIAYAAPLELKWLFSFLMLIGRIEILPIIALFVKES
jgi:trk system potassium uptake protein TrkH